jgi:hypothetical protein
MPKLKLRRFLLCQTKVKVKAAQIKRVIRRRIRRTRKQK